MQLRFDLPEPAALARRHDPATSHAAADRVKEFAAGQHETILKVLRDHGPCTAHEIATYCRLEAHAVGKRLGELETAARIRVVLDGSGKAMTRSTPSGRQARVWFAMLDLDALKKSGLNSDKNSMRLLEARRQRESAEIAEHISKGGL
jgi:hypothetical protein